MRLLLSLFPRHRPSTPADIDSIIRASWPDPHHKPNLFEVVQHCMVHGLYSHVFLHAPYMKDGKCSKGFPKPFQQAMLMTTDGYPIYTQPPDGCLYNVGGFSANNWWIVPYNPFLLLRYIVSLYKLLFLLIFHMQVQCPHKCRMCYVFGCCKIHH
jgi:hypothetical protein